MQALSVELAHVSLGQDYVISASIGISLFPRDGKTYAELFAKADAALYQIKTPGAVTSPCTGKCQKRKQRP